ncbi:hypothetical protein BDW02DRAFT_568118 [Decorospora gaudefroyi]|uniref:Uncharacterized protein n=1 Tax=Decorospora gaudefroyi TaxID=184978 RepID=A0A6A5KGV4_9PLEO|nr:hypothetical protein BDW02DRAFT_568118 [Decorospora gaudefroyi]
MPSKRGATEPATPSPKKKPAPRTSKTRPRRAAAPKPGTLNETQLQRSNAAKAQTAPPKKNKKAAVKKKKGGSVKTGRVRKPTSTTTKANTGKKVVVKEKKKEGGKKAFSCVPMPTPSPDIIKCYIFPKRSSVVECSSAESPGVAESPRVVKSRSMDPDIGYE